MGSSLKLTIAHKLRRLNQVFDPCPKLQAVERHLTILVTTKLSQSFKIISASVVLGLTYVPVLKSVYQAGLCLLADRFVAGAL